MKAWSAHVSSTLGDAVKGQTPFASMQFAFNFENKWPWSNEEADRVAVIVEAAVPDGIEAIRQQVRLAVIEALMSDPSLTPLLVVADPVVDQVVNAAIENVVGLLASQFSRNTYDMCGGLAFSGLDYYLAGWRLPTDLDAPAEHSPFWEQIWSRHQDSLYLNAQRFVEWKVSYGLIGSLVAECLNLLSDAITDVWKASHASDLEDIPGIGPIFAALGDLFTDFEKAVAWVVDSVADIVNAVGQALGRWAAIFDDVIELVPLGWGLVLWPGLAVEGAALEVGNWTYELLGKTVRVEAGGRQALRDLSRNEWNKLKAELDAGRPAVVGLVSDNLGFKGDHQLVAFGYDLNYPEVHVHAWDNNLGARTADVIFTISGDDLSLRLDDGSITSTLIGWFVEDYRPATPTVTMTQERLTATAAKDGRASLFVTGLPNAVDAKMKASQIWSCHLPIQMLRPGTEETISRSVWSSWGPIGPNVFPAEATIAAAYGGQEDLALFVVGLDPNSPGSATGRMWMNEWSAQSDSWRGWTPQGSQTFAHSGAVSATSVGDGVCVAALGSKKAHDGNQEGNSVLVCRYPLLVNRGEFEERFPTNLWTGWMELTPLVFPSDARPVVVSPRDTEVSVYVVGFGVGLIWSNTWTRDADDWGGWESIGNTSFPSNASVAAVSTGEGQTSLFAMRPVKNSSGVEIGRQVWESHFPERFIVGEVQVPRVIYNWSKWQAVGTKVFPSQASLAATSATQDQASVFVVGATSSMAADTSSIWSNTWTDISNVWTGWARLGDTSVPADSGLAAVSPSDDATIVAATSRATAVDHGFRGSNVLEAANPPVGLSGIAVGWSSWSRLGHNVF